MRIASIFVSLGLIVAACGGDKLRAAEPDSGSGADGSNNNDGSTIDAGAPDSRVVDSGGGDGSAGNCTPPDVQCADPCPTGTVCLSRTGPGPQTTQLGCTPIPPTCNDGAATCDCMSKCFCQGGMGNTCTSDPNTKGLICVGGPVSRRAFKKDIGYVSHAQRDELADEALSIPLATYRYKVEADDHKKHLGFIIDDQPENSPAVQSDRTHVDEYGYTSMLLATVQKQQEEIDALNKRLAALEKSKR